MLRNIEIKARIEDQTALAATEARVARIADRGPEDLNQQDVFFHTPRGRLKLRIFDSGRGELIYYEREDQAGPKLSRYFCVPTNRPLEMRQMLTTSFGIRGIVNKRRRVYWVGDTRVHLDQVEGLGEFLELEVVLSAGQTPGDGQRKAEEIMDQLQIRKSDLIEGAYADLLRELGDR